MFWPLWILAPPLLLPCRRVRGLSSILRTNKARKALLAVSQSHFMYWLEDAERVEEFIQSVWASWGTELWMKGADCFQQKLARKLLSSKSLSVPSWIEICSTKKTFFLLFLLLCLIFFVADKFVNLFFFRSGKICWWNDQTGQGLPVCGEAWWGLSS